MTQSAFTPGPWAAKPSKYEEGVLLVQAGMPSNRVLAAFGKTDPIDDTDRSNARLIAAAPSMLLALIWLVGLKDERPADYEEQKPLAWAAARAAIEQATGQKP